MIGLHYPVQQEHHAECVHDLVEVLLLDLAYEEGAHSRFSPNQRGCQLEAL